MTGGEATPGDDRARVTDGDRSYVADGDRSCVTDGDAVEIVSVEPATPTDAVDDPETGEPVVSVAGGRHLRGVFLASVCDEPPVGTTVLADWLGVAPATVTERVTTLADRGLLVREPYVGVKLTDRGERIARTAQWRQCVVERFFEATAGVRLPPCRAYRVGVALPTDAVRRLHTRLHDDGTDDPPTDYCEVESPEDCRRIDCALG